MSKTTRPGLGLVEIRRPAARVVARDLVSEQHLTRLAPAIGEALVSNWTIGVEVDQDVAINEALDPAHRSRVANDGSATGTQLDTGRSLVVSAAV